MNLVLAELGSPVVSLLLFFDVNFTYKKICTFVMITNRW